MNANQLRRVKFHAEKFSDKDGHILSPVPVGLVQKVSEAWPTVDSGQILFDLWLSSWSV